MKASVNIFSNRYTLESAIIDTLRFGGGRTPEEQQSIAIDIIMCRALDLAAKGFIDLPDKHQISVRVCDSEMYVDNKYTANIFNFEHPEYIPNTLIDPQHNSPIQTSSGIVIPPDIAAMSKSKEEQWLDEMLQCCKLIFSVKKYTECSEAVQKIKEKLEGNNTRGPYVGN